MKRFLYFCVVLACLGIPAKADPQADVDYIVSQSITREIFEAVFEVNRSVIISAIQNDLRAKGITLPDPHRFYDLLMAEFMAEFVESMRDQSAAIYIATFSEEELKDIAAFIKTSSGQAYFSASKTLMEAGSQMGEQAAQKAGVNAGKRLAARIESEGLMEFDDPGILSRLLDTLR